MFAESVPGKTGSQGPVLFPMGYWEEGTYKQIWNDEKNIPTATPYVLYKGDNKHYVLMVEETTEEPGDGTDWQLMENFSALYTDILLADRATVGNACFYGNYMFSQEGNGELSSFDITTDNPYESEGFKPAWCVNLITGEMWAGTGTSYFGADGSGYVANKTISWDSNGNITKYPKATGVITAKAISPYTHISANVTLSGEWENIDDVEVEIIDNASGSGKSEFPKITELNTPVNVTVNHPESTVETVVAWGSDCLARLYVNDILIAESIVIRTDRFDVE